MECYLPRTYHADSPDTMAEYPEGHYVYVMSYESLEARLLRAFATALGVSDARGWKTGDSILASLRKDFHGNEVRPTAGDEVRS